MKKYKGKLKTIKELDKTMKVDLINYTKYGVKYMAGIKGDYKYITNNGIIIYVCKSRGYFEVRTKKIERIYTLKTKELILEGKNISIDLENGIGYIGDELSSWIKTIDLKTKKEIGGRKGIYFKNSNTKILNYK